MNRFFRSALFPLIIIAALVWLALQTLGHHGPKTEKQTLSGVQQLIESTPNSIRDAVFSPNKQQLTLTVDQGGTEKKISVYYPSESFANTLAREMKANQVTYDSHGTGSSPWWWAATAAPTARWRATTPRT